MSKRVGNRTGREAKKRARRHQRRADESMILKAWLLNNARGALTYGRRTNDGKENGLRKLVRIGLAAKQWENDMLRPKPLRFLINENTPSVYRYGLEFMRISPRLMIKLDGV